MKKIFTLFIFFCGVRSFCQDPKFETLKLTSAPAYTVLGVDPQNIQRPTTPTDFIAGAQSAIVNGKLQPNFAIEATPFYWKHPKTDSGKRVSLYQFIKDDNNVLNNIARTFTFSFATSESDTLTFGNLEPGTGFGIGFRCNLFNGNVSRKTLISSLIQNKLIDNLYQSLMGQLQVGNDVTVKSAIDKWRKTKKNTDPDHDALVDFVADFGRKDLGKATLKESDIDFLQQKIDAIEDEESKFLTTLNQAVFPLTREGFMLELALGNATVIQNNEAKNITSAKTAIWLTPSYRINTRKDPTVIDFLDFMAVLRMTFNNSKVDVTDYFDIGAKVQYTHNRFSLSGEYIARMLTKKPTTVESKWTNRVDVSFDYKINDLITFKATFGRNFDGNSVHYSDPQKIFAVGGVNFGFGEFLKKNN
ncbi:MAG TPA: hypothetical protein VIU35_06710 [Chitinophagaceae bacterium]